MPFNALRCLLWGLAPLTLLACQTATNSATIAMNDRFIPANSDHFALEGRAQSLDSGALRIGYPGVTLHTHFEGQYLALRARSAGQRGYIEVAIVGEPRRVLKLEQTSREWVLVESGQPVSRRVEITHRGETWLSQVTLEGATINEGATLRPVELPSRKLLIVGDSVTCGYGTGDRDAAPNTAPWWNPKDAYGRKLAEALSAQVHLVCHGGRGLIRSWNGNRDEGNAPEFFEWAIANKASPVAWDHNRYQPDLILVSLGTNDFNLGIGSLPEQDAFVGAYVDFLNRLRAVHPQATIALTEGAMVNDQDDPGRPQKTVLRRYIKEAIERTGQPDIHFVPASHFPGDDRDSHPTGPQHTKMAEELRQQLQTLMAW